MRIYVEHDELMMMIVILIKNTVPDLALVVCAGALLYVGGNWCSKAKLVTLVKIDATLYARFKMCRPRSLSFLIFCVNLIIIKLYL